MKKRSIVNTSGMTDPTGRQFAVGQVVITDEKTYGNPSSMCFGIVKGFTEKSIEVGFNVSEVENALTSGGHMFTFTPVKSYYSDGKLIAPTRLIIFPT